MIAPQELRLGNWININGSPFQVELPDLNLIANKNGKSTYEPIELNEDWLRKFGFEKKAEHNFELHVLTRSIIHAYTHDKVEIELGNRTRYSFGYPAVKNVHQLQNLTFALTGEELKIKES